MSYERLQITDHVDKWDVAKVQHLEDAIIANEIAINNAADWNQNDASASDYIKNKPFYETKSNIQKICTEKEGTVNTQFSNGWYGTFWYISDFENLQWPNNGQICSVTINGEKYEAILIGGAPYLDGTDGNNFYLRFNGDGRGLIEIYYATAILDETCVVSIDVYDNEIKQLDEKFIPNSIARSKQSDWDQYNSTFMDYVKNRTHYRDYQWQSLKLPWDTDAFAVPGFVKLPIEALNESALYNMLKYNNLLDQYCITAVQLLGNGIPIQGYIISDINTGDVVLSSVLSLEHNYMWSMYTGENRAFTPTELGLYVYCTIRTETNYVTLQDFYYYESPILSWTFPNFIYHTLDSQYLPEIPTEKIPHTIARTTSTILEDITETPTAEQYNALLQVLRDAGILAIE